MLHKNRSSFMLPVCAAAVVLLCGVSIANACSCAPKPTVLDAYEGANTVVITRVVGFEKSDKRPRYDGVVATTMTVEKVFKGSLKVGDEMVFAQGGGADCIWTFDEQSLDQQYLFYLGAGMGSQKIWYAGTCGRSRPLQYAGDDLLYLNNLDKVRGKARISGTVSFEKESGLSVEGRKIRIIGADKTYQVKTDKNGVYEIYDLPAGQYLVEPEIPFGWKLDQYWVSRSRSLADGEERKSLKQVPIMLQPKKHVALDIHFEIDNAIRGRLYDPTGKPMEDVCVQAVQAQGDADSDFHFDCTDEDGRFEIGELPRGSYLLVINGEGKISSTEPFTTFYYPNVLERDKATAITISEGEVLDNINIYAPKMEETITVEGVFLYADGKPVVDENVQFEPEKTKDNVDAEASAKTNAQGRFTIKILKGLKGKLYGEMYTYAGEYENCPRLDAIIKKSGQEMPEIRTPVVEIQAENNLYDVELKYPFPGCKKAK